VVSAGVDETVPY